MGGGGDAWEETSASAVPGESAGLIQVREFLVANPEKQMSVWVSFAGEVLGGRGRRIRKSKKRSSEHNKNRMKIRN